MNILSKTDEFFMQKAFKEAEIALEEDEVPIGCIIVYKDAIIGRAHNQVERLKDPTAHAEMLAITQATSLLKSKFLNECKLYVTIEPCLMCAGAMILSRLKSLVFAASDPKGGAFGSKIDIDVLGLNHKIRVKKGILEKECSQIMKMFFEKKRNSN